MKLKDMTSKALGFPDENRMYISESLPPANRELLNKAYKLKKDLDYKFLWTSNRRVLLRATEAPSVISIHSLDLVKKNLESKRKINTRRTSTLRAKSSRWNLTYFSLLYQPCLCRLSSWF